jgi:hypothetical protein
MPSIARSAQDPYVFGDGAYRSWDADWSGFTVSVEKVDHDVDGRELFADVPGGGCQCPHWGYVLTGTSTYYFADRVEEYVAGDFFHLQPGHRPAHVAGTEWVCFSPTDLHNATQAVTRARP